MNSGGAENHYMRQFGSELDFQEALCLVRFFDVFGQKGLMKNTKSDIALRLKTVFLAGKCIYKVCALSAPSFSA